jgi:hypothetical protein
MLKMPGTAAIASAQQTISPNPSPPESHLRFMFDPLYGTVTVAVFDGKLSTPFASTLSTM